MNKRKLIVIGGQIVGFRGAGKRIDSTVASITTGLTSQQLADLDMAYALSFSNAWDPVQVAARKLLCPRKMKRMMM